MRIEEVEGIGPAYADKLNAAGIKSTDDLLMAGGKAAGRATVAEATGITEKLVVAARPGIVRRVPTESEIGGWIAESAKLDKVVEHLHRAVETRSGAALDGRLDSPAGHRPGRSSTVPARPARACQCR